MAKFTTVKCWFVAEAITEPDALKETAPTFNIVKKSILKNGYRGYAIEDREVLESQEWYKAFLLGDEVRFYLDGSGVYRMANCDLVENELYFERLNIPIGYQPWIFYSWQSDHNSSRSNIKDALDEAVAYINSNLAPRRPLVVLESTRAEDGAGNIIEAVKANIDRCMFAIFDITNVSKVLGDGADEMDKHYPNANVVFELSYALVKKRPEQVLLLKKQHKKDDVKNDNVPFDFDQNKRVDFDKPAQMKKQVLEILTAYLHKRNFIKAEVV